MSVGPGASAAVPPVPAVGFAGLGGVARRDITPPVGIFSRCWGAAKHECAEGVHRPLSLTALALRQEGPGVAAPLVMVSVDGAWWQGGEGAAMHARLSAAVGLPPENLWIGLTHTHAAVPLVKEEDGGPGAALLQAYLGELEASAEAAIREALRTLAPVTVDFEAGLCQLAVNRDLRLPDGTGWVVGLNPCAPADATLVVGRVLGADGRSLATLVNYACHPTTLAWENRLLSPDFCGSLRETVERATGGAPCLFLQGASGDLSPAFQYTDDVTVADRHGRRLGHAALAVLEGMPPRPAELIYVGSLASGADLALWRERPARLPGRLRSGCLKLDLALRPDFPSLAEALQGIAAAATAAERERWRRKVRLRAAIGEGDTWPLPVWWWETGGALWVATPTEAYSAWQVALRAAFPERRVVVMNLVNGSTGYLPPVSLYDAEGVYAAWQTPFGRGGLERLIDAGIAGLRAATGNDRPAS